MTQFHRRRMYNATKDDLTAILLSGLDGAPLTHREEGISTTSWISMASVKHINYAPQARKRQTCVQASLSLSLY